MECRIPEHVIKPKAAKYLTVKQCPPMNRSSRGYAILRALGAHEKLSDKAVDTLIHWSNQFHNDNNKITPHTKKLLKELKDGVTIQEWFRVRISNHFEADIAAINAAAYPGNSTTLSYEEIFKLVWIERKWSELCNALSE